MVSASASSIEFLGEFWVKAQLTSSAAANQMAQQMGMANPAAMMNPMQPGQDPDKLFLSEAENLEVMEHFCILNGVEERVLRNFAPEVK